MIIAILSILVHIINIFTIFYIVFKEKRSANMDTLSCELNFEVNALIYSEKIAKK